LTAFLEIIPNFPSVVLGLILSFQVLLNILLIHYALLATSFGFSFLIFQWNRHIHLPKSRCFPSGFEVVSSNSWTCFPTQIHGLSGRAWSVNSSPPMFWIQIWKPVDHCPSAGIAYRARRVRTVRNPMFSALSHYSDLYYLDQRLVFHYDSVNTKWNKKSCPLIRAGFWIVWEERSILFTNFFL